MITKLLLLWFCLFQASTQAHRTQRDVYSYEFKQRQPLGAHLVNTREKELHLTRPTGTIYSDSFSLLPTTITELYIDRGSLDGIEPEALCLHPFEKITIYGTRLPELTREMFGNNCPSLTYFKYSNDNNITGDANFSPDLFSALPNLQKLYIHDASKFPRMTREFVKGASSLVDIQVAHSNLRSIEAGAFDDLVNLQYLELSDTKLESVDGLWSKLTKLLALRVVKSDLKSFPWHELKAGKNVKYVELQRNKFEDFDADEVAKYVPGLVNLTLWGNPIPCEKLRQGSSTIRKSLPQAEVLYVPC